MKRTTMFMCLLLAALFTSPMWAQKSNTMSRSEQFIIDSLRLDVERANIVAQLEMYSDSLTTVAEMEECRIKYSDSWIEATEVVIPLAFFAMIVAIVWICTWLSYRKKHDRYHIIELAIEHGQPVPDALFKESIEQSKSWVSSLRTGLVLVGVGISLIIFGLIIDKNIFTGIASMPILIGIAYIAVAVIERRETLRKGEVQPTEDGQDSTSRERQEPNMTEK